MNRFALVVLLAGCGRVGFAARGDANGDAHTDDVAFDDASPLDSGLLLHFAFESDGVTIDRAAGRNATCTTCPTLVAGHIGMAAQFSGTSCLQIADQAPLEPTQLTLALWVNVTTPQFSTMMGKTFHGDTSSADSVELSEQNSPDTWNVYMTSGNAGHPVSFNGWHHLAAVVGATQLAFYVDGALTNSISVASPAYTSEPWRIGCDVDNNVELGYVQGMLDDVRLYNRTLTPAEIAALAAM